MFEELSTRDNFVKKNNFKNNYDDIKKLVEKSTFAIHFAGSKYWRVVASLDTALINF